MAAVPLCMVNLFKEYDQIRSKKSADPEDPPFWDIVVLTTSDARQKLVCQQVIADKLNLNHLPGCARYHVIHDPEGPKIGSGGSTLYTLNELVKLEPEWKHLKILLVHAGGQSQRLPSASVLGKAFTAVPIGNPMYTMLDVKLALCMPYAAKLPPGVFICCPDTFETFTFGNNSVWSLRDKTGFIALAHPSPMHIGTGHGVYILGDRDPRLDTEVLACARVLQKPNIKAMYDEGAVVPRHEVPDHIRASAEDCDWTFTDSNFFFDHTISQKFLELFREEKPLCDEICAYGDFLQPLGYSANDSYILNMKNVTCVSSSLCSMRRKLYDLLKGTQLNVVALKQSKFYHIGTLREYIDNFCDNSALQAELGFDRFCYSAFVGDKCKFSATEGCVIHSLISSECSLAKRSVVEFCNFSGAVTVQDDCVVSNCVYTNTSPITIPSNTFLQTVPVEDIHGNTKYITLLFSLRDNMKASVDCFTRANEISYFDRGLHAVCDIHHIEPEELFDHHSPYSLWHAKLFPAADTAQASLVHALSMLKKLLGGKKTTSDRKSAHITMSRGEDNQCTNGHGPSNHHGLHMLNGLNLSGCVTNGSEVNGHFTNGSMNGHEHPAPNLYSFADVIRDKDTMRMIYERNSLATLIQNHLC